MPGYLEYSEDGPPDPDILREADKLLRNFMSYSKCQPLGSIKEFTLGNKFWIAGRRIYGRNPFASPGWLKPSAEQVVLYDGYGGGKWARFYN